jgi:BirA family biotin operon repressor/biotin-[acetyl-CoA-carboxylase] ligase
LQENRRAAARHPIFCVTDRQTAGRGRRGRAWVSTPEGSLTFSLRWRFARDTDLSGLSLAVGLALRQGLDDAGVGGVVLKWPNDLLIESAPHRFAKLGGILIELALDGQGVNAVIGVGLNLRTPQIADFSGLAQPAAGLDAAGPVPERHHLLAALVAALGAALGDFGRHGFAPLREAWNAAHAFDGQEVLLHPENADPVPGRCLGVDADGALRVLTAAGETRWLAGDVSLRKAEPAS